MRGMPSISALCCHNARKQVSTRQIVAAGSVAHADSNGGVLGCREGRERGHQGKIERMVGGLGQRANGHVCGVVGHQGLFQSRSLDLRWVCQLHPFKPAVSMT
jgi:hypothetical protein